MKEACLDVEKVFRGMIIKHIRFWQWNNVLRSSTEQGFQVVGKGRIQTERMAEGSTTERLQ